MDQPLALIAPVLIAVGGGVSALAADAFASRRAAVGVAVVALLVATGVAAAAVIQGTEAALAYGVFVAGGGFSATIAFVLGLSALTLAGASGSFAGRPGGGTAAALVAFSAAAASALALSLDLVMTLIALETMAACAYGLVSGARTPRADEAAMKYLVQGAAATGMIALGTAILVGLFGAGTTYQGIAAAIAAQPVLPATAAGSLVMVAFAFKLGAAPFHTWAPDVFDAAPSSASAFLATAPKVGALAGLFVVVAAVFDGNIARLAYQIAGLSALSIVIGNFAGLRQASFTRMLGYSGIAQIGYALVGLAVGAGVGNGAALQLMPLVLVLVVAYSIAAAGAFLTADMVRATRPEWDGTVSGMAGFGRERPVVSVALAVFMFSLTGIPLTAGFWGKVLVFGVAIQSGWSWLAWIAILGSVVSFGYYGSVLRAVFFETAEEPSADTATQTTIGTRRAGLDGAVVVLFALLVLGAGLVPLFAGIETLVSIFSG